MICPIPGCDRRRLNDSIVCLHHALTIWDDMIRGGMKTDPILQQQAIETTAAREQREAEHRAKVAEFNRAQGWIYYLRLDGMIKIGWTSNLPQRLQSYPPHYELIFDHPGTRADERDLHRSFRPSLASGREWYHPTPEILTHIQNQRARFLPVAPPRNRNPFAAT